MVKILFIKKHFLRDNQLTDWAESQTFTTITRKTGKQPPGRNPLTVFPLTWQDFSSKQIDLNGNPWEAMSFQ